MGYNAWDVFRRTPFRSSRGRRAAVDFVVCLGCGGISSYYPLFFFNAHGLLYEAALPDLPLYY